MSSVPVTVITISDEESTDSCIDLTFSTPVKINHETPDIIDISSPAVNIASSMLDSVGEIDEYEYFVEAHERKEKLKLTRATDDEINKFIKSHRHTTNVDLICNICLEDVSNRQLVKQLPCNHAFHSDCLRPWLKIKASCPTCRIDITFLFDRK